MPENGLSEVEYKDLLELRTIKRDYSELNELRAMKREYENYKQASCKYKFRH